MSLRVMHDRAGQVREVRKPARRCVALSQTPAYANEIGSGKVDVWPKHVKGQHTSKTVANTVSVCNDGRCVSGQENRCKEER